MAGGGRNNAGGKPRRDTISQTISYANSITRRTVGPDGRFILNNSRSIANLCPIRPRNCPYLTVPPRFWTIVNIIQHYTQTVGELERRTKPAPGILCARVNFGSGFNCQDDRSRRSRKTESDFKIVARIPVWQIPAPSEQANETGATPSHPLRVAMANHPVGKHPPRSLSRQHIDPS